MYKNEQEHDNQVTLFMDVRKDRGGKCEVTGKIIHEPASYCFAHVLPKGTYPEHKYNPNNIIMVSTFELHNQVDRLRAGEYGTIEEKLKRGERITFNWLKNLKLSKI